MASPHASDLYILITPPPWEKHYQPGWVHSRPDCLSPLMATSDAHSLLITVLPRWSSRAPTRASSSAWLRLTKPGSSLQSLAVARHLTRHMSRSQVTLQPHHSCQGSRCTSTITIAVEAIYKPWEL